MKSAPRPFALALFMLLVLAGPATAAESHGALFGGYWQGFLDFWQALFQKQNGVVMAVLGIGVVALFIITRGKWNK